MGNKDDYIELIEQARLGDQGSLNRLAERTRAGLRSYVYRLTLSEDVTEDILQETMLEMFKFIDKLESAARFWPWLRRIAANKVNHHYTRQQGRREVSMSGEEYKGMERGGREGAVGMVAQELRVKVSAASKSIYAVGSVNTDDGGADMYIGANAVGECMTLVADGNDAWTVTAMYGTWTVTQP